MPKSLPPFAYSSESKEFEQRWFEEIPKRLHTLQTRFVPERNILKFSHGQGWTFNNTDGEEVPGEFKQHGENIIIPVSAQQNGELEKLTEMADEMARKFSGGMDQLMEQQVTEITEKTGNVFEWKPAAQNAAEIYLLMLDKTEFSIKPDGNVSEPTFSRSNPGFIAELQARLESDGSYRAQVAAIKARKTAEARERDAARKAKFKQAQ